MKRPHVFLFAFREDGASRKGETASDEAGVELGLLVAKEVSRQVNYAER